MEKLFSAANQFDSWPGTFLFNLSGLRILVHSIFFNYILLLSSAASCHRAKMEWKVCIIEVDANSSTWWQILIAENCWNFVRKYQVARLEIYLTKALIWQRLNYFSFFNLIVKIQEDKSAPIYMNEKKLRKREIRLVVDLFHQTQHHDWV